MRILVLVLLALSFQAVAEEKMSLREAKEIISTGRLVYCLNQTCTYQDDQTPYTGPVQEGYSAVYPEGRYTDDQIQRASRIAVDYVQRFHRVPVEVSTK